MPKYTVIHACVCNKIVSIWHAFRELLWRIVNLKVWNCTAVLCIFLQYVNCSLKIKIYVYGFYWEFSLKKFTLFLYNAKLKCVCHTSLVNFHTILIVIILWDWEFMYLKLLQLIILLFWTSGDNIAIIVHTVLKRGFWFTELFKGKKKNSCTYCL